MSRKKKIAIISGAILIIYSLIGFIVIPLILESILPDKLSESLKRPVSIENIRFNPFALTAAIEGLNIKDKNPAKAFISFDELFVNVQTMSLFKMGLVVKEVRLTKPDIHITRISETGFNFSDLLPEKQEDTNVEKPDPDAKPFQFSISNIAVIDGNITFDDQPIQKTHTLSPINFSLPNISNFEKHIDSYSEPVLNSKFNHATISIDVDTKPFHDSIETIVNLSLKGVQVPYYFAYIPEDMVNFEITSGSLGIDTQISFFQKNDQPETTVSGTITLADLEIIENNGNRVLKLPKLAIDVAPSRPMEQELKLASIHIQSPELSVARNPEGVINLTTLGPSAETAETPEGALPAESAPEKSAESGPFLLNIEEFLLDSGNVFFTDYAATPEAAKNPDNTPAEISIDDMRIKLSGFSTAPDTTAEYDMHACINTEAEISATGMMGITPLYIDSDFDLTGLKLAWGQPYIPATIQLIISDGKFTTSGHAAVHTTAEGEIKTTITCNAAINEFNSIDPAQKETFVSWSTFSFNGIEVSTDPLKINTDKILLKDFKNQLIVFNDGASNLAKIFVKPEPATDADQKPSEPETEEKPAASEVIPVRIGEVLLDNFDFQFMDRNIDPHFSTRVNLSELRVTGLTSEDFKAADLKAKGKIDEYAPIKIKGSLNPLKEDLFLDITYSLTNMELSPLSPYTGKYIGQAIEKGKLSTNVVYKIDKKEINAQNRVLLDQFTLGQSVESEDALNLPVGLALALLKDRNGQINVELPISGRTDDPDFGFGKPLLNALTNLIVKAATSPFDLVSAVVGGGEELRYIEFEAAAAAIDDAGAKKLDAIINLMFERPGLKLDISGYVDIEADRAALTDLMLARKIKNRKLKKDSSKDIALIDAMKLSPEEYQKLLKQVYVDEILSDPKNKKSLKPVKDPTLTIAEIETIIRSQITVTDAEMRLLARKRAQQVKAYLLQDKSVTPDRLFLVEPDTLSPEKTKAFKSSRVDLNVR